jgi:hypothetical protein
MSVGSAGLKWQVVCFKNVVHFVALFLQREGKIF